MQAGTVGILGVDAPLASLMHSRVSDPIRSCRTLFFVRLSQDSHASQPPRAQFFIVQTPRVIIAFGVEIGNPPKEHQYTFGISTLAAWLCFFYVVLS